MKRLVPLQDDFLKTKEVKTALTRIIAVCKANDRVITRDDARNVWMYHSRKVHAGWLSLPDDDAELFRIVDDNSWTVAQ